MHQHTGSIAGSIAGNTNKKNELFSPLDNLRKTTQNSQPTKVLDPKFNNGTSNHGIYNNHHNTSQYKRYSTSSFVSLSSIATSNTMTQPIKPISSLNSNEDVKEDRDVEEPRLLDDLQLSEYEEEMIKKALMQQQQDSYQTVQGDKSANSVISNNGEGRELKENKQGSSMFAGKNQKQPQYKYHDLNEILPNYQTQRKKKDISLSNVFVPAQGFLSLSLDSKKMKNNGMRNRNGSVHQRNFSTSYINDQNIGQKSVLPIFEKPFGKDSLQQSLHKKSESWSIQRSHINEVDLDGELVEVYDSVQELLDDTISRKLANKHSMPVEIQPEIVTPGNANTIKNKSNVKEVLDTPHTSSLPATKISGFQFPAAAEKSFEYKNESSVSSDDENSVIHNEQFNATYAQSQFSGFKSPKSRKGSFSFGSKNNKSVTPKKQIGTSQQDYYYYPPPTATEALASASPSHSPVKSSSNTSIHLQPPVFSTPDNKTGNKHHKKKSSTFSIKNIFKSSPKPPSHSHSQSSLATESSIFYDGTATVSNAVISIEPPRFNSSSPLKKNGFVYYPQQEPPSPPRPPKFVTQTSTASVNSGRKLIESEPIVSSEERIQQAIDLKFQGKLKESTDQLFMACQENDKMAYLLYGLALKFGTGIQRNVFESLKYLKKACGINKKNDESNLFEKYDEIDPYELSLNSAICVPDIPPEPLSPALYEIGILYLRGVTTNPNSDIALSFSSGAASDLSTATVKNSSSSFSSHSKDSSNSPVSESFLSSSKAVHKNVSTRDSLENNSVDDKNFMNNNEPETTKTECVEIDELKALKYLELSASLGNKESILICGSLWSKERPAVHPKDLVRSAAWFRIAESKGCKLLGSDWIYREKYLLKENSTTIFKKK